LALIDYFHDLSVLRDGDGINFQKASATLDGCVKIYSSRVDSAVTETGRLISGLATRKVSEEQQEISDLNDDKELDDMHPDAPQRIRRPKVTSKRDTLLEFEQLKVKKMDLELYVDPLFKKALADFDEGGSKSLLLNMLSVDSRGKIIFDTTESARINRSQEENTYSSTELDLPEDMALESTENLIQDIMSLGQRHLSHVLSSEITLCPSVTEIRAVVDQKSTSSDLLQGLGEIQVPEQLEYNAENHHTTYQDFNVSFGGQDNFDPEPEEESSKYPGNRTSIFFDDLDDEADDYGITMRMLFDENKSFTRVEDRDNELGTRTNIPDEDLLAYFDENQRRTWAGPEHWKISKLKNSFNFKPMGSLLDDLADSKQKKSQRQPKEKFIIDFLSDEFPDEEAIYLEGSTTMYIPRTHWISKDKNVLPDDKNFKTRNFITLFTTERLINSRFNKVKKLDQAIDESLYAENTVLPDSIPPLNNPDFFNDHSGGPDHQFDMDYGEDLITTSQSQSSQLMPKIHGSQLPLNYSRVSKKVDVKLLKDNLWDTLNAERSSRRSVIPRTPEDSSKSDHPEEIFKFSNLVTGVGSKYDPKTKKDISTSFCFICLLHLANENGFTITNTEDNSDLLIKNFQNSRIK
jgi:condensin complex subunit 2